MESSERAGKGVIRCEETVETVGDGEDEGLGRRLLFVY